MFTTRLNHDKRSRKELLKEIQTLQERQDELETLLIECKRAMDANTEMKSLYEVAQDLIELKRAQEALKQERDYFKNVLDNSADAIGIVDARGRFRRWNKRAEELFGYSFEELNGRSALELYADQSELEVMLAELRRKGYVRDYEISIKTKKGRILPFGMSISKLTEQGKTIGSVCVARDLTQIKQAEAALRKSKEAAEAANRAKSEFLANMSHEIRTPMNAILGFSEALLHKTDDQRHQQYLRTISSSGQTLLALIDDILDLSKIEAGRLEVRPEPLDLRRLIKDLHLVFKPELERKGLDFILILDPKLPQWLVLDEIRIRQILMNLVGNAVKFTRSGFVRLAVHGVPLAGEPFQTIDLIFEVEDSGIGIPASQQEVIFENFRQQDNQRTREFGGTGLGLAITRKLVELMQGSIFLDSDKGRGALFRVRLPGVAVIHGDPAEAGGEDQAEDVLFEPQTILVVDDHQENIDLVRTFLQDSGLGVIEARSGHAALEMLNRHKPGLVLMDLRMPGMDGYDTAGRIKQAHYLPVIALSAATEKHDLERITTCFDGYLPKPISRAALISELRGFLPYRTPEWRPGTTWQASGPSCPLGLDHAQRARLSPEVLNVLDQELLPRIQELQETLVMDEVEVLALEMKQLAQQCELSILQDWSTRLNDFVQNYDVSGVKSMLAHVEHQLDRGAPGERPQGPGAQEAPEDETRAV